MKRNRSLSACPTAQESVAGGVYFIFQLLVLPSILRWVNAQLSQPLTETELNFTYYLINFLAAILIYHEFLGRSARQATQHIAYFCQAVVLGLAAYYACNFLTLRLIRLLVPSFTNYNDEVISAMSRSGRYLMVVSTVILVPPAEECVFRGLIFRNLYGKSLRCLYSRLCRYPCSGLHRKIFSPGAGHGGAAIPPGGTFPRLGVYQKRHHFRADCHPCLYQSGRHRRPEVNPLCRKLSNYPPILPI